MADGAVIWCAKLSVTSRATRVPYGVEINDPYDSKDPDHVGRTVHRHDAGYDYVTGKWSQIVGKVCIRGLFRQAALGAYIGLGCCHDRRRGYARVLLALV